MIARPEDAIAMYPNGTSMLSLSPSSSSSRPSVADAVINGNGANDDDGDIFVIIDNNLLRISSFNLLATTMYVRPINVRTGKL